MLRLFRMVIVSALLIAHGLSYAAGICQHRNAQEHALARGSSDPGVAAAALAEEAAAAASKESLAAGASTGLWAEALLPPANLPEPVRIAEPIRTTAAAPPPLTGKAVLPLLEPPIA